VGLDTDKTWIVAYVLLGGDRPPVETRFRNEAGEIRRFAQRVKRQAAGEVYACYEAGPSGYAVQRLLREEGVACDVVAPSMTPRKPGDRVKTDRRDARKLAELLRAGLLTVVADPTPEEEAVRDLCRCRASARKEVVAARHRVVKFLNRRLYVWREGRAWTQKHRMWLRGLELPLPIEREVLDTYLQAVEEAERRLEALEEKMEEVGAQEPYREPVGWLCCYRGVRVVTALSWLAELHGLERFGSARRLMAYLGMVPREYSSGGQERRGGITKAGNAHLRRLLVEAAWHYIHRPAVGKSLAARRKGQPRAVIAHADRAQHRLHKRCWALVHKGKSPGKAIVAVARELAGFLWATALPAASSKA
jgi:transposase